MIIYLHLEIIIVLNLYFILKSPQLLEMHSEILINKYCPCYFRGREGGRWSLTGTRFTLCFMLILSGGYVELVKLVSLLHVGSFL